MAEVYNEETLVASYPPSPRPRRQPMTSLSTNQRSYSRMSSKGIFGDESPLLLSPLPKYPNRRRSITFADETEATVREERPHYTMWEAGTTPNVRWSESPTRRPVLKPTRNNYDNDASPAATKQQHDTSTTAAAAIMKPLTPKRTRSTSQQRRAARRKQAELHYGFYDDSFVEEYVLKAKRDIEGEEEEEEKRRLEEGAKRDEDARTEAEVIGEEATVKINALQRAKEYLLSTANARYFSPACSSSERKDGVVVSRLRRPTSKEELDLLQQIDEEIGEMGKVKGAMRQRALQSVKCSVPLVTHVDEMDVADSRKRVRQSSSKKEGRSVPIVQRVRMGSELNDDNDDDDGSSNMEDNLAKMKKAKLERIIARVVQQQAKRRHGKRSVVVIDWDCADSDELLEEEEEEVANDNNNGHEGTVRAAMTAPQSRKRTSVRRSVDTPREEVAAPPLRQRKPPATTRPAPARGPSARRRKEASVSLAPDLGEDLLLLEEDQPVLLRRPTTKRHVHARSISYVSADADENPVFEHPVDVSRKPPQRVPAPKATRRGRKASTVSAMAPSFPPPSVSPPTAASRSFISARHDSYASLEAPASVPLQACTRRRQRTTTSASKPVVSSADPMDIFFGASFPSPSKFEEMMLAAGGVPETRRAGRGQTRQPALLLPDTISRHR